VLESVVSTHYVVRIVHLPVLRNVSIRIAILGALRPTALTADLAFGRADSHERIDLVSGTFNVLSRSSSLVAVRLRDTSAGLLIPDLLQLLGDWPALRHLRLDRFVRDLRPTWKSCTLPSLRTLRLVPCTGNLGQLLQTVAAATLHGLFITLVEDDEVISTPSTASPALRELSLKGGDPMDGLKALLAHRLPRLSTLRLANEANATSVVRARACEALRAVAERRGVVAELR
jgi:hypothetical protein